MRLFYRRSFLRTFVALSFAFCLYVLPLALFAFPTNRAGSFLSSVIFRLTRNNPARRRHSSLPRAILSGLNDALVPYLTAPVWFPRLIYSTILSPGGPAW